MSDHKLRRRRPPPTTEEDGPHQSQTQRRRNAAISLNSFSSKKGHDRALQEYKKRKDEKFQKNATLLREYQRAMKQEGYEVGKGASRKRRGDDVDDEDGKDDDGEKGFEHKTKDGALQRQQQNKKKRHKSDPLLKAKQKAERAKSQHHSQIKQQQKEKEDEVKKQHDRMNRAKKMMQRTKRGQPLMKNVIGDLLGRIKSEVGEDA